MATNKRFVAKNGIDNNSNTITNVADPVSSQDVATKAYADNSVEFVATQNINLLDGDNAANHVYLDGTHFGKILRVTNTTTSVNYGYIYLPLISSVPNNGKQNITIMNNTEKGFDVRIVPRSGEVISDRANIFFTNGIITVARRGIVTVRVIDGKWHLINEDDIVNVAKAAATQINYAVSVSSDGTIPTLGTRGYLTLTVTRTAVGRYTLTMPSVIWGGTPQAIFVAWDDTVPARRFFSYHATLAFPGNSSIFLKTLDETGNYVDTSFHCIISYPTENVP